MPEDHYSFKPTPEIMSFGEQLVHIAGGTFWFGSKIGGEEGPAGEFKAEGKSKAEIIEHVDKSFEFGQKAIESVSDAEAGEIVPMFGEFKLAKSQIITSMFTHITHHRGQMVIYLRLKGIKPPQYVGW